MTETIHVAWGASRADSVRDALRLQGCEARVIALTRIWSLGPIEPFDKAVHRAWFAANTRADPEPSGAPADLEAPWTEATAKGVHPVYWVCLTDAFEHACFLEFASRMAGRPFDIVDATGLDVTTARGCWPVWSLGQLRPEEIVTSGLLRRRRPFSRAESDAAVATWAQLRRENAPVRIVRDGRMVSAPLTHFDAALTAQAMDEPELLIKLIARTLHHLASASDQPEQGFSHELLFARALTLGETGALEIAGPGPGMRDYKVRRPAAR